MLKLENSAASCDGNCTDCLNLTNQSLFRNYRGVFDSAIACRKRHVYLRSGRQRNRKRHVDGDLHGSARNK